MPKCSARFAGARTISDYFFLSPESLLSNGIGGDTCRRPHHMGARADHGCARIQDDASGKAKAQGNGGNDDEVGAHAIPFDRPQFPIQLVNRKLTSG
jgi:hypothetical protein